MELKELCNKTMELFEIADITELGNALMNCVKNNDVQKYSDFQSIVGDLSVDWLQMIFQYYNENMENIKVEITYTELAKTISEMIADNRYKELSE